MKNKPMKVKSCLGLKRNIWLSVCILILALFSGCTKPENGQEALVSKDNLSVEDTVSEDQDVFSAAVKPLEEQAEESPKEQAEASSKEQTEESAEEKAEALTEYKIVMVGDVLLHTPVEESCKQADGSYDYDSLFANTKDEIAAADLALVNQEVIIGGAELGISGYPCFNADYSLCDSLADAGFDVICHATNHAMDKGRAGLLNCAKHWREQYPELAVLGIHDTSDTSTFCGADPWIIELPDMSIAVLNYTYGTNGIPLPENMPYAVDLLDEERVASDIRRAEELADFTIVCPHWGTEYRLTPDASQEKWTRIFVENGADLVLGTHPHVIEPVEWVTDPENGHEMLVYYSLGNFVNWTSSEGEGVANRMVGGMAEVTITRNSTGEVEISDYGVRPLISHVTSGPEGVSAYFLEDYSAQLEEKNEIVSQDPEFSLEYCIDLCNSVWGDLWKEK